MLNIKEIAIILGLIVNLIATVGTYVNLRVELEHRLTKLEAQVHIQVTK